MSGLLAQVPAGSRVTVLGITDNSFAQPYILLSATVSEDEGYFKERLAAARQGLVQVWKRRSVKIEPRFMQTDVLGAFLLAAQEFQQAPSSARRILVAFSDMVQETKALNLKKRETNLHRNGQPGPQQVVADLKGVEVYVLGVEGSDPQTGDRHEIRRFWVEYLEACGAKLVAYSVLRDGLRLELRFRGSITTPNRATKRGKESCSAPQLGGMSHRTGTADHLLPLLVTV